MAISLWKENSSGNAEMNTSSEYVTDKTISTQGNVLNTFNTYNDGIIRHYYDVDEGNARLEELRKCIAVIENKLSSANDKEFSILRYNAIKKIQSSTGSSEGLYEEGDLELEELPPDTKTQEGTFSPYYKMDKASLIEDMGIEKRVKVLLQMVSGKMAEEYGKIPDTVTGNVIGETGRDAMAPVVGTAVKKDITMVKPMLNRGTGKYFISLTDSLSEAEREKDSPETNVLSEKQIRDVITDVSSNIVENLSQEMDTLNLLLRNFSFMSEAEKYVLSHWYMEEIGNYPIRIEVEENTLSTYHVLKVSYVDGTYEKYSLGELKEEFTRGNTAFAPLLDMGEALWKIAVKDSSGNTGEFLYSLPLPMVNVLMTIDGEDSLSNLDISYTCDRSSFFPVKYSINGREISFQIPCGASLQSVEDRGEPIFSSHNVFYSVTGIFENVIEDLSVHYKLYTIKFSFDYASYIEYDSKRYGSMGEYSIQVYNMTFVNFDEYKLDGKDTIWKKHYTQSTYPGSYSISSDIELIPSDKDYFLLLYVKGKDEPFNKIFYQENEEVNLLGVGVPGYSEFYWEDSSENRYEKGDSIIMTSDMVLYLVSTSELIIRYLYTNGGMMTSSSDMISLENSFTWGNETICLSYKVVANELSELIELNDDTELSREGYRFLGWGVSPSSSPLSEELGNALQSNSALYALMEPKKVTLNLKGAEMGNSFILKEYPLYTVTIEGVIERDVKMDGNESEYITGIGENSPPIEIYPSCPNIALEPPNMLVNGYKFVSWKITEASPSDVDSGVLFVSGASCGHVKVNFSLIKDSDGDVSYTLMPVLALDNYNVSIVDSDLSYAVNIGEGK